MFDDLRQKSAQQAEFLNEEPVPAAEPGPAPVSRQRRPRRGGLSISAAQGFVLALMLFLNVTVLGILMLVVFDKIALPFF
jgi:hypothetical protein